MTYFKQFFAFLTETFKNRRIILELTKNDFRKRYLGSYFGIFWAFIQPTVTILIFWFVFQVGFKSVPVDNLPFILWLISGIVPWFFFSDSVLNATYSIVENSYLVNKVVFRVSILPIIKIWSALFIHLFFIGFTFLMFFIYGYKPTVYNLQIVYYLFAMCIFILGISWITSSLIIFLKDIGQLVGMLLQFGFWLTPIFWSFKILPERYHTLIELNPMYYIVEGYRSTFIYNKWFWESPGLTVYYWLITFALFALGALIFKRLRPHFADVL